MLQNESKRSVIALLAVYEIISQNLKNSRRTAQSDYFVGGSVQKETCYIFTGFTYQPVRCRRSSSASLRSAPFPRGKAGRCRASGTRQDVFAFICAVSALLGRTPARRFDVFSKLLPGKGTKQPPGFQLECSGGGLAPLPLRQVPFTAWTELWVLNPSQGSPCHMLQHQGGAQEDHCGQQCQQGHNDVRLLFGHGILLTFRCF